MANMNQVVKLSAFANNGVIAYAPVDGTISTNFYKIFYNNSSATRHFFIPNIPVFFTIVIERIAANNSACLYHHIVADDAIIHDANIGMNDTIAAYTYPVANKCTRINKRVFSNNSTLTDGFI